MLRWICTIISESVCQNFLVITYSGYTFCSDSRFKYFVYESTVHEYDQMNALPLNTSAILWLLAKYSISCCSHCVLIYLAVDCGGLSAPVNGSIQGSATTFPNAIEFSCDSGFLLEGSAVRKCQANATWSGKTTTCQGTHFFVCLFANVVHKSRGKMTFGIVMCFESYSKMRSWYVGIQKPDCRPELFDPNCFDIVFQFSFYLY